MKQHAFEQTYASFWDEYDALLEDLKLSSSKRQSEKKQRYEFPSLFRKVCHHYAIAQQRHYSPHLINALHSRVLKGHQLLYERKGSLWWRLLEFVWITFPNQLRRHWRHFWIAVSLFYVPAIAVGLACFFDSEMIYQIMPDRSVAEMEYMYDPENRQVGRSEDRQADSDFMMFGYYIYNNISIGFRTYALGILAGIGTVFILLYNGLVIGGVAGHLTQLGFTQTFWPFVSGHGSFELTAIVICGAAGLRLAQPLISPGRYRRLDALKIAGKDSVQLVMGAALMLLIAAFIEAFWSSSNLLPSIKYAVASVLWLLVILYLWRAGRGQGALSNHAD